MRLASPVCTGVNNRSTRLINGAALMLCVLSLLFSNTPKVFSNRAISISASELEAIDQGEPALSGSGFAPDAVFSFIAPRPHVTGVPLFGSAVTGDTSTGSVHTRWYRAAPSFYLLLCGYPALSGGDLSLEVFSPHSGVAAVHPPLDENPEYWRLQKVSLSQYPHATKFRVVATDNSTRTNGWLGFSPPFEFHNTVSTGLYKLFGELLRILLCASCSLVLFLGVGIALRAYLTRKISTVWLPVPGLFLAAVTGLFIWVGPAWFSPAWISRLSLSLTALFVLISLIRRPLTALLSLPELKVLAMVLLLIVIAVAKGTYSIGPSGELYKGRISRTLEAGSRGDSRISYHVVQLIGLRLGPHSIEADRLFAPWNFSHRGPLAALAVGPVVVCRNATLSADMPDASWTPFDPQGFASYRIAMIVLAASSLFMIFGLARLFLDDRWAILAVLCIASAPFTVHEIYFTWPKIPAAGCVLLAAYLLLRKRFFTAGLSVGAGYLFHPSALLFFPAVLMIVAIRDKSNLSPTNVARKLGYVALASLGLAVVFLAWVWINVPHFHQTSFLDYFRATLPFPFTPVNWLRSRAMNIAKTLIPGYTFAFHRQDPEAMSWEGVAQPWVQFVHQYWATLPFAVGIVFFVPFVFLCVRGFSKAKAWMWLVIVQPFVLFVCYMGPANTGLMRDGLHTWYLGLMLFAIVIWRRFYSQSKALWTLMTVALSVRGLELLLMLIPFSSWSRGYVLQPPFIVSDICCLTTMTVATMILSVWTARYCYIMSVGGSQKHPKKAVGRDAW